MLGDGAMPRRPGGGTPGVTAPGAVSGVGDMPGVAPVSAWMPLGAEQDAVGLGLGAIGAVPSAELAASGVPGTELGALGMAGGPGDVGARLGGGAGPRPTSGSQGAPAASAGDPAG